jgi:hypothetical protein
VALVLAIKNGPVEIDIEALTNRQRQHEEEKPPPVTFQEIVRYAYDHAGDLRAVALRERDSGRLSLVLE